MNLCRTNLLNRWLVGLCRHNSKKATICVENTYRSIDYRTYWVYHRHFIDNQDVLDESLTQKSSTQHSVRALNWFALNIGHEIFANVYRYIPSGELHSDCIFDKSMPWTVFSHGGANHRYTIYVDNGVNRRLHGEGLADAAIIIRFQRTLEFVLTLVRFLSWQSWQTWSVSSTFVQHLRHAWNCS